MFATLALKFMASPAPARATGYRIPYGRQSFQLSQTAFFGANAIEKGDFLSLLPFFRAFAIVSSARNEKRHRTCDSEQCQAREKSPEREKNKAHR